MDFIFTLIAVIILSSITLIITRPILLWLLNINKILNELKINQASIKRLLAIFEDSESNIIESNSSKKSDFSFNWDHKNKTTINSKFLYPKKDIDNKSHFFYNKVVVITGQFDGWLYRDEICEELWNVGADVNKTVSKNTDYLVVGKVDYGHKKIQLAIENNIRILYEEEFLQYFPNFKSRFL
ncbi:BRCT domain-containing protein [Flavobacteriaceae bacterium TK19130]|nr:BRCT domain-containing protein [Thermobacterium salinum]